MGEDAEVSRDASREEDGGEEETVIMDHPCSKPFNKPLRLPPTQQLFLDVMDGNPGALMVIKTLVQYPLWQPLLRYLQTQGFVGSVLWATVKDDYDGDIWRFSRHHIEMMTEDQNERLYGILR